MDNLVEKFFEGYKVIRTGGSCGDKPDEKEYNTKEEAQAAGKAWVKSFGKSKSFYHPGYRVKKVKESVEGYDFMNSLIDTLNKAFNNGTDGYELETLICDALNNSDLPSDVIRSIGHRIVDTFTAE